MPSTLSTEFGQGGILATSPAPYQTPVPGHYRLTDAVLTPGIPVFNTGIIYKLSNGPKTPDISVKFQQMIPGAPGSFNIDVYAV